MANHTPAPWEIIKAKNARKIASQATHHASLIAHVYAKGLYDGDTGTFGDDEQMEANAQLIAAAPELLDACKNALKWIENVRQAHDWIYCYDPIIDTVKDAIEKAEAEQHTPTT